MKFVLLSILILQLSTLTYCYVEALTANLDNGLTHFQPMIAMLCNQHGKFHNQYLNEQKQWVTDNDPTASCIKDKLEILEYCRKVYPKKDIRNIVESSHYYKIDNWKSIRSPRHHLSNNEKQHFVKPIRCLEGNFQSDALLVPEHCLFDHIHNSSVCEANTYWNKTANQSCKDKGKLLQSYAMLLPCGVGIFNGVEFVCCPTSSLNSMNEISDKPIEYKNELVDLPFSPIKSNSKKLPNKKQRFNKIENQDEDEDDNSSMEDSDDQNDQQNNDQDQDIKYEDNDFAKYNDETNNKQKLPKKVSTNKKLSSKLNQQDDDEEYYDDDYEDEQIKSSSTTSTTTTTEKPSTTTTETPLEHYYSHFDSKNEHNLFKLAEETLKRMQLEKMKKVFKEYADFQTKLSEKKSSNRLNDEMELDDNLRKNMEKRYEDALESLEIQNNEEKQQLNAMHQQRVLTLINMKKQEATDCYTSSLNQTPLKPRKIQKCLEKLMKSLEKDRIHTLHHYKHLLMINSKLALKEKKPTLTHLENLIVIANRSISMLNKYPTLNEKIRNHIIAFWHNLRGVPFNQLITKESEQQIMEKYEEEIVQKQQEKDHKKAIQEAKKEEEHENGSIKKSIEQLKNSNDKIISKQEPTSTLSSDLSNGEEISKKHQLVKNPNLKTYRPKLLINKAKINQEILQKPVQVSNIQHSRTHHDMSFKLSEQLPEQHHLSFIKVDSNRNSFLTFSIAGIAILAVFVFGIVLYRNSRQPSHLSQGFVALQQNQQHQLNNNEQEHVQALQINGYLNPTFSAIFEKNII